MDAPSANDHARRHEEGGLIYANATTEELIVRRVPLGESDTIDLSYPPALAGAFLIATNHTQVRTGEPVV